MFPAGPRIRIVLSGADPALDRLGRELAARLPGVELGDAADPAADINYYIPLAGRGAPAPTREAGWVSDAVQDAEDLDLVICDSADLRAAYAQAIVIAPGQTQTTAQAEDQTWMACADAHMNAFEALAREGAVVRDTGAAEVALLLHGDEHKSLGGPSVRVPRTAQALRAQGVAARAGAYTGVDDVDAELVHLFNVWNPASALLALRQLKAAGKRVVFSPIYLDLRARSFWQGQLPDLPLDDLEAHGTTYRKAQAHLAGRGRLSEPVAGYNAMVRAMLELADHVIFLSQAERDGLAELGAVVEDERASLVPNPVDAALWQAGDAALFHEAYLKDLPGPQDYVICVGRIEERKNQLLLARALRDLPVRLVLVGHEGNPAYADRVRRAAGPDFLIVDRLDPAGAMLRSAVAGARVFCLPSWSEGASLAALEAAAAGAQMVLGDRSSERAYFGDLAAYCDVGDPRSIAAAVETCLAREPEDVAARAQALRTKVAEEYTWAAHARATADAYACAAQAAPRDVASFLSGAGAAERRDRIVFDLTTLAQAGNGGATDKAGAQAEALLAEALEQTAGDVQFICWSDPLAQFVEVPAAAVGAVSVGRYVAQFDDRPQTPCAVVHAECTVVVAGDIWQRNGAYLWGLEDLKARSGCAVLPLIHGLDPLAAPFRYAAEEVAVFRQQFHRLAQLADGFVPVSDWTAQQTQLFAQSALVEVPQITPLRLGDPVAVPHTDDKPAAPYRVFGTRRYVLVAGTVAARANLEMLLRVWAGFAQTGQQDDLHLVIAGEIAASGRDIPDRIARDPRIAHRVHVLGAVKEDDLGWLYRNCLFTVFAAHEADCAAPVAQSLAYAKPCLASDTGAVVEIAPDLVEHIAAEDFQAWQEAIARYAASPALRHTQGQRVAHMYRATGWSETAQALREIVQTPRAVRLARPVLAGERLQAGTQGGVLQALFQEGWHPRDTQGRWACAPCSHVTLNLARQAEASASIMVLLHLDLPAGATSEGLVIRTGAQTLFNAPGWGGSAGAPCDVIVMVPVQTLDAQGCVTLTFERPLVWALDEEGAPVRQVGIGVQAVVVLDPVLCNPLQALRAPDMWSRGNNGVRIDMLDPAHRDVLGGGCDFSPAWGLGGRSARCDIVVPVLPGAVAQRLRITCRPVACPDHPVAVQVFWNDRPVAEARWCDDRTAVIEVALGVQDMAGAAPHVLSVQADSLLMPVDLGLGLTENIAGVGVLDVELVPEGQTE